VVRFIVSEVPHVTNPAYGARHECSVWRRAELEAERRTSAGLVEDLAELRRERQSVAEELALVKVWPARAVPWFDQFASSSGYALGGFDQPSRKVLGTEIEEDLAELRRERQSVAEELALVKVTNFTMT